MLIEDNMADESINTPEATSESDGQKSVIMKVQAQYIRDVSFENILAQRGSGPNPKPDVKVQVALDARKMTTDHRYEVIVKINIESSDGEQKLFVVELEYAGIFHIENVPQDQMHPFLMIECPRQIFPFIRRIVHDLTRDGGFPPLNLEQIDFVALYRREIQRRMEDQKASEAIN